MLDTVRARAVDRVGLRAGSRSVMAAAGLSAICLLVNPFGWRICLVPFGISEALAPANLINPEWAAPSWSDAPLFFAVAVASVLAVSICFARRRPLSGVRAALLLATVGMGLSSVRHIGVFFSLLPLAIDTGWAVAPRSLVGASRTGGVALAVAVTTWMILVPPPGSQIGVGMAEGRFPEKAADFIDARLTDARLYNDVSFGGYLIWRGYPQRRVFIDGRNEVHARLLKDLSEAIDDGRRWRDLLDRHGVEGAVVAYRDEAVPVRDAVTGALSLGTFSELHFPSGEWALVYWDDLAMVFVRRGGRYREVAVQLEYRRSRPEGWRLRRPGEGIVGPEPGVQDEIRRKLAEDAGCRLAKRMATLYGTR